MDFLFFMPGKSTMQGRIPDAVFFQRRHYCGMRGTEFGKNDDLVGYFMNDVNQHLDLFGKGYKAALFDKTVDLSAVRKLVFEAFKGRDGGGRYASNLFLEDAQCHFDLLRRAFILAPHHVRYGFIQRLLLLAQLNPYRFSVSFGKFDVTRRAPVADDEFSEEGPQLLVVFWHQAVACGNEVFLEGF